MFVHCYKVMKRTRMCFERTDRAIRIGSSPLCGGSLIICYMFFLNINAPFRSDYFVLISQHNLGGKLLYSHIPPICQGGGEKWIYSHFSAYPGKGEIWPYCHDVQKSIPLKMNLSCLGAHENVKWAVLGH